MLYIAIAALGVLLLVQPLCLKLACAMVGVRSPSWMGSIGLIVVSLVACGFAGGIWSGATAGAPSVVSGIGGVLVMLAVAGAVHSAVLRVSYARGVAVGAVGYGISTGLAAAVAFGLRTFVG